MAEIQTLYDRESGKEIYPITSSKAVIDENGVDIDTKLKGQQTSLDNSLKNYAKTSEVNAGLAGKQAKLSTSADLSIDGDNMIGLTPVFKESKLNTSVWEENTEQFTQYGIIRESGIVQDVTSWQVTPFIPINRKYDIEYHVSMDASRHIIIQLYDESVSVIMTVWNDGSNTDVQGRIAKEDIPANAVYFRINKLAGDFGSYANSSTFESREGAVSDAILASKKALFIDQWNEACGEFGSYNAKTGFFELNGLTDISYKEALMIYNESKSIMIQGVSPAYIRTNIPFSNQGVNTLPNVFNQKFRNLETIEAIRFYWNTNRALTITGLCSHLFVYNRKMKRIMNPLIVNGVRLGNSFISCWALEEVRIMGLTHDVEFDYSPNITLESFGYMINHSAVAANSSATIKVHPEVYAKLTDETNTEWHQILLDAAEKNIQFATT